MGLLDMVGLGESPFGQFANNNRYALGAFGAGLAGGRNIGEGLAMGAQNVPQARMLDYQRQQQLTDEQKRKSQLNQTMKWMQAQAASDPFYADLVNAVETEALSPAKAWEMALTRKNAAAPTTDDIKEFGLAQQQGYQGSFMDYMTDMKKAGATNVTTNVGPQGQNFADPPFGQDYRRNPDGTVAVGEQGMPEIVTIPGGPAARKEDDAAGQQREAQQADVDKARTLMGLVSEIRDEIAGSNTPVTGTFSRPLAALSGTPAGRVRSYTRTLQSGVALNAMMRLKAASATGATGFGAMNAKELDLLINDIGALDPDTTEPDIFLSTLEEIERRAQRVIEDIARNVSPERIRELGLEPLISGGLTGMGAPATGGAGGVVDFTEYFR